MSKSYFKHVSVVQRLALPPACLRDIHHSICGMLNRNLMKYMEELGGVFVCYWDLELVDDAGRILYDYPEVHVRIAFKALLFAPTPGTLIVGEVNKVGVGHVGLLVLGAFNASIPAFHISPAYKPHAEDEWKHSEDDSLVIAVGRRVAFTVSSISVSRGIITIVGSMMGDNTGPFAKTPDEIAKESATAETQILDENHPTEPSELATLKEESLPPASSLKGDKEEEEEEEEKKKKKKKKKKGEKEQSAQIKKRKRSDKGEEEKDLERQRPQEAKEKRKETPSKKSSKKRKTTKS